MSASLPSASFCCDSPRSYQGDLISAFGEETTGLKGVRWFVKQVTASSAASYRGLLAIPRRGSPLNTFLPYPHSLPSSTAHTFA